MAKWASRVDANRERAWNCRRFPVLAAPLTLELLAPAVARPTDPAPPLHMTSKPPPELYFIPSTHAASRFASSAVNCGLAAIGTGPQAPPPPLTIFWASIAAASGLPA